MITTMKSKLKMNLHIAPTETSFCESLRLTKNSRCFQKVVQFFNLMRTMLQAYLRKADKQQVEINL